MLLLFNLYCNIWGKKHNVTIDTNISTEIDNNFSEKSENVMIKIVNHPNKSLFIGMNKNDLILTNNQIEMTLISVNNSLNKALMINNKFLTVNDNKLVFKKNKKQLFKIILINVLNSEFVIVFNNTKCLNFTNKKLFLGSCKAKTTGIFTFYIYKQSNNDKNNYSTLKKNNMFNNNNNNNNTNDNDSSTDNKNESNSERENIDKILKILLKNKYKKKHHKFLDLDSYSTSFNIDGVTKINHKKSKDDRKSIESDN